jgi:hypothetical protein
MPCDDCESELRTAQLIGGGVGLVLGALVMYVVLRLTLADR